MHVSVERLSKRFGRVVALEDVTLNVTPGQIVAILGADGAGKTTLLRCLAGILAPNDGEILYDGEPLRRSRIDLRRRFGFLADAPFVYPEMTTIRHVGMAVRLYETKRDGIEREVVDLLREFDLLAIAERPLNMLSRGQKYKAALVGLLAVDPEVWLLDEPFASGMDPPALTAFRQRSREAVRRGRTIIYSTQILDVAERFSDLVCILHHGRVRALDSLEALRHRVRDADDVLEQVFAELDGDEP